MTINEQTLKQLAALAYLDSGQVQSKALTDEVNVIINFIEQLKTVDTTHISPLYHPIDTRQSLRDDIITETNCQTALEAIAPDFHDGLYWVPKIIDGEES